jgi:AraC-like DNA-binding protein
VKGSPARLPITSAEFGLDDSAYHAAVLRQVWTLDPDVNTIAIAFALVALLQRAGGAAVEFGEPEHVPRWIDSFRQVLAGCLNDRALLLRVAARRMAVSPRTLQRFLEREGTTWRAEVEVLRCAQATSLQRAGLSKSQVARRLGYSDGRALRRAVKRWERDGGSRIAGRKAIVP